MTSSANAEPKGSEPSSTECDHPDNDPCDRCLMPRSYCILCGCGHVQGEHRTFEAGGCTNCRCKSFALPPEEPPLTPEEEEQAPEDEERPASPCPDWSMQEPHTAHDFETSTDGAARCPGWEESPPQPERRPPFAVTYSVQGHLYEVALSGDASVHAVDGALIIKHGLGPVAGIVSVLPIINKESPDV